MRVPFNLNQCVCAFVFEQNGLCVFTIGIEAGCVFRRYVVLMEHHSSICIQCIYIRTCAYLQKVYRLDACSTLCESNIVHVYILSMHICTCVYIHTVHMALKSHAGSECTLMYSNIVDAPYNQYIYIRVYVVIHTAHKGYTWLECTLLYSNIVDAHIRSIHTCICVYVHIIYMA